MTIVVQDIITDEEISDMGFQDGIKEESKSNCLPVIDENSGGGGGNNPGNVVMEQALFDDGMEYQNLQAIDDEVDIVMTEFDVGGDCGAGLENS